MNHVVFKQNAPCRYKGTEPPSSRIHELEKFFWVNEKKYVKKKEKKEKNGLDFTLPGYIRYDAPRKASRFEQPWVSVRNRR